MPRTLKPMRRIARGRDVNGALINSVTTVIPAKARIQTSFVADINASWTPAFAGVAREG